MDDSFPIQLLRRFLAIPYSNKTVIRYGHSAASFSSPQGYTVCFPFFWIGCWFEQQSLWRWGWSWRDASGPAAGCSRSAAVLCGAAGWHEWVGMVAGQQLLS
eukprot:752648-Hanusia_phi.AAC.1